jgi:hypothetical protein
MSALALVALIPMVLLAVAVMTGLATSDTGRRAYVTTLAPILVRPALDRRH